MSRSASAEAGKSAAPAAAASSSPAPSGTAAAAASPKPVPSLLLHHACFRNDVAELERLLSLKTYDVNGVDVHGNTALHLCVMMRHTACMDLLLDAGASANLKNRAGWSALHEATSMGDRDVLRRLWTVYKKRVATAEELSGLLSHLASIPDFRVTFSWTLASWIPFVSRFLPRDTLTISKKGTSLRVDCSMLEFTKMKWVYHPYSFLLKPRCDDHAGEKEGAQVRGGAASAQPLPPRSPSHEFQASALNPRQPYLVYTLDHELQRWQCVNAEGEKERQEQEHKERAANSERRKAQEAQVRKRAATAAAAGAPPTDPAAAASSASAIAAPAASSSSSSSALSAPSHPAAPAPTAAEIDLEFELDDFLAAPVTSAFSPGRVRFLPVASRSWKSWRSWTSLLGVGTAPQRVEQVGGGSSGEGWSASVWTVDHIRVRMQRRFEHLSKEEIEEGMKRSGALKSLLSNPAKLRKTLQEKQEEEEEFEGAEDAAEAGEEKEEDLADFEHRPSLPPPPPSNVSFATYFSPSNQRAYDAAAMEAQFDRARDAAAENDAATMTVEEVAVRDDDDAEDEEKEGGGDDDDDDADDASADPADFVEADSPPSPQVASPPPAMPAPLPAASSSSASSDAPWCPHLGRPILQQVSEQKYSARLWMSDSFPLEIDTVVRIVRLLFGDKYPQIVARFEHFVREQMPPGFPVRIVAPIIPALSVDVSIKAFAQGDEVCYGDVLRQAREASGGGGDDEEEDDEEAAARAYFSIPPAYEREEQSEEEQMKMQQRYRKRWKAAESRRKQKAGVEADK